MNLIAPVEASLKSILKIYIFEKVEIPTPYTQVKWWKMYISQSENSKSKSSKFQFLHAVTLVESKICSVSLTVSEITANLRFQGHVT